MFYLLNMLHHLTVGFCRKKIYWSYIYIYDILNTVDHFLSMLKQDADDSWHWSFWGYNGVSAKSFKCISIQAQSTYLTHFLMEVTTARYCIFNFYEIKTNIESLTECDVLCLVCCLIVTEHVNATFTCITLFRICGVK